MAGFVLAVTVVILPIFIQPGAFDPWRFPKVLVVRASAILLLTIYGVFALWAPPDWRELFKDKIFLGAMFIIGWVGLSAALSPQPEVSWWAWFDVLAGFTLFLAAISWSSRTGSRLLLWLILITAAINIAVLFLQLADIWHPLLSREEQAALTPSEMDRVRRSALMGNRNDLGLFLLFPLAVLMGAALGSRRLRVSACIGGLIVLLAVILSTTITAIAAAMLMIPAAVVFIFRGHGRKVLVYLLVVLAVVAGSVSQWDPVERRLSLYVNAAAEGDFHTALGRRLVPFRVAIRIVTESPLVGIGPGRFGWTYVDRVIALRLEDESLSRRETGKWLWQYAHNDYLESAAEAGVPVIFAWAFLLIVAARSFTRRRSVSSITGIMGIVAISVGSLLLYPLQLGGVYGVGALMIGSCLGTD